MARLRWWRTRLALRLLRIPRAERDPREDDGRWSLTVTRHASRQAMARYGTADPHLIAADVSAALATGRFGARAPRAGVWGAKDGAVLAWSEDHSRIYVLRRTRFGWMVLTALPTEKDVEKRVARIELSKPWTPGWPSTDDTAVARAFREAQERVSRSS